MSHINAQRWCFQKRIKHAFDSPSYGDRNKIQDLVLWLLIWGEAANMRHCFTAESTVALPEGISVPIADVVKCRMPSVLSYHRGLDRTVPNPVEAWTPKGSKPCVELLFSDGTLVSCTPDHRFLSADGTWVPASEIKLGETKLKTTVMLPQVSLAKETALDWSLQVPGLDRTFAIREHWAELMALMRILGYLITDGTLQAKKEFGKKESGAMYMGSKYDADCIRRDILLLTGESPVATDDGDVFRVALPQSLATAAVALGAAGGCRVDATSPLPDFLVAADCPLLLVREFVGAMFGGDGCTVSRTGQLGYSQLAFVQSKSGSVVREQVALVEDQLAALLARLGIPRDHITLSINLNRSASNSSIAELAELEQADAVLEPRLGPNDIPEPDRTYCITLAISMVSLVTFADNIGFRLCAQKQSRLSAACAYYRQKDLIHRQRAAVAEITRRLIAEREITVRQGPLIVAAFEAAKVELACSRILHPDVAAWSLFRGQLQYLDSVSWSGASTVTDQLAAVEAAKFFSSVTGGQQRSADGFGCFVTTVLGRRAIGAAPVYDLTVYEDDQVLPSFVVNGRVVHNCPEYLCFVFYRMSMERQRVIDSGVIDRDHMHDEWFRCHVITPAYNIAYAMQLYVRNNGSLKDHPKRPSYDDLNEYFWNRRWLDHNKNYHDEDKQKFWGNKYNKGFLIDLDPKTGKVTVQKAGKPKDEDRKDAARRTLKTFPEKRSWLNLFRSFFRIVELHLFALHLLILFGYDFVQKRDWRNISTCVLTPAGLAVLLEIVEFGFYVSSMGTGALCSFRLDRTC